MKHIKSILAAAVLFTAASTASAAQDLPVDATLCLDGPTKSGDVVTTPDGKKFGVVCFSGAAAKIAREPHRVALVEKMEGGVLFAAGATAYLIPFTAEAQK